MRRTWILVGLGTLLLVASLAFAVKERARANSFQARGASLSSQVAKLEAAANALSSQVSDLQNKHALVPGCRPFGPDGDRGSLFCLVDNPGSLAYLIPTFPHLFALKTSASAGQVASALRKDAGKTTPASIVCGAYLLAANAEGWSFHTSPVELWAGRPTDCSSRFVRVVR